MQKKEFCNGCWLSQKNGIPLPYCRQYGKNVNTFKVCRHIITDKDIKEAKTSCTEIGYVIGLIIPLVRLESPLIPYTFVSTPKKAAELRDKYNQYQYTCPIPPQAIASAEEWKKWEAKYLEWCVRHPAGGQPEYGCTFAIKAVRKG